MMTTIACIKQANWFQANLFHVNADSLVGWP